MNLNLHFGFAEFLAEIPLKKERKCAWEGYISYCFGANRIFGEPYVGLIADYLGLAWDHTTDMVRRLTIYLRAFTIVDDDLKDVPSGLNDSCLIALRRHFLDCAWMVIDELSSPLEDHVHSLTRELHRYNEASDFYTRLHHNANEAAVDWTYTEHYADRMALVRVPFLLLAPQADDERLSNGIIAIENLMTALQILDDLVDWQEDLREGRLTYPTLCYYSSTSTTFEQVRSVTKSCPEKLENTIRDLNAELPYHPVIREQLEQTGTIVKKATNTLKGGQGNQLLRRTMDVGNGIETVLDECRELNAARDNLILRIQRSGVAPQRLHKERGENVEHRRASID